MGCEITVKMHATKPLTQDLRWENYGETQPLPQFTALMLVQSAILFLLATIARRKSDPKIRLGDLLLLGIGTHKLSRLVAKD
jgi:hypothetical protein